MEERNYKISGLQLATIVFFITDIALIGSGIINVFLKAKQDSWISVIITSILGLIPLLMILYIASYKPDKNLFEKNKILFGKIAGTIINFILVGYMFFILTLVIRNTVTFATTIYLTKTPTIFISGAFILAAIYAVIKGIEAISRTSETLFFIAAAIIIFIVISLAPYFHFNDLKPILADGFGNAFDGGFLYMAYSMPPLILITIIPKNHIDKTKQYNRYMLLGFSLAMVLSFIVFIIIPGSITPKLASLYRFPAYYIQRKISVGGAINNVENITCIHWFFNNFILSAMSIYFINAFIKDSFNVKKGKTLNITAIIAGIIAILFTAYTSGNPASFFKFMQEVFEFAVALVLFIILLLITLFVFIKNRIKKTT